MAYITNNDIEERLGTLAYVQLTDDGGTGSADLDKVAEARSGAEGEADSYLATRYAVPVDLLAEPQIAAVLKSFVLDIAEYRLHNRRPPVPADVARRRNEAIAWLQRVATGAVQLPATVMRAANAALGTIAETAGPARMFTRDNLEDA